MWNTGSLSLSIGQVTLSGQQNEHRLNPQAPPFNPQPHFQQAPPMNMTPTYNHQPPPPPNFQAPSMAVNSLPPPPPPTNQPPPMNHMISQQWLQPTYPPPPNFQAPPINPMVPHPPNFQAPQINPLRAPNQMGPFFPTPPPPYQNKQVFQLAFRVQNKEVAEDRNNNNERNTGVPSETEKFQGQGTSLNRNISFNNAGNNDFKADDNFIIEDQSLALCVEELKQDSSIDSESSLYDLY
ncbi:hypothetical protein BgiMline_000278 [Biomphalaria glabrata]|nr:hypothetical protein BgiMline_000261 [Biomphalaria glabrata]